MNTNLGDAVNDLRVDWMAWLVLRHFLPAAAQRAVVECLVKDVSGGTLELREMIDEVLVDGPMWNDAWVFREQRSSGGQLTAYLQRVISAVAWQNDSPGGGIAMRANTGIDPTRTIPEIVEILFHLSSSDFSASDELFERLEVHRARLQPSTLALIGAFAVAREQVPAVDSAWADIEQPISHLPPPLRFVATKHLSDLWVDSDRWRQAEEGYRRADAILEAWRPRAGFWSDLAPVWRGLVGQSRATARRVLETVEHGAHGLKALTEGKLSDAPVRVMNAALDEHVARSHPTVDGLGASDSRVRELRNPLIASSHTPDDAIVHWLNAKHQDAHRHWWAVLRRQVALGADYEARHTRALYARNIFEELNATLSRDVRPSSFSMGVRLMMESGRVHDAAAVRWSPEFVSMYVSDETVELVLTRTHSFQGTMAEREQVAIVLLRAWVELLPPDRQQLGERAWRVIADVALKSEVHLEGVRDVARPAFEALGQLARRRPEWIQGVANEVSAAVLDKLDPEEATRLGHEAALSVAREYLDAMDSQMAKAVVVATLRLLESIDPEHGAFPVVRPALVLLVSERVKKLVAQDGELGEKVFETILRFGTSQESEAHRLIFYLHDFDRRLLSDQKLRSKLAPALEETRRGALEVGNSDVCTAIDALLIAPTLSGPDGLRDALEGLYRVVSSASSGSSFVSLGLADAYDPILDLCLHAGDIQRELADDSVWKSRVASIADALTRMWQRAQQMPNLLAPFSIPPPTQPHPVVVHNWAFATRRFADVFGYAESLMMALHQAELSPALAPHVTLAGATRALSRSAASPSEEDIRDVLAQDRESFYLAVGRWLVRLQQLEGPNADKFVDALLGKVLRFGPRSLDAAVLLAGLQCGAHKRTGEGALLEYAARLKGERELNLVLGPVVDLLLDQE